MWHLVDSQRSAQACVIHLVLKDQASLKQIYRLGASANEHVISQLNEHVISQLKEHIISQLNEQVISQLNEQAISQLNEQVMK